MEQAVTIELLPIPESLDDQRGADFRRMVDVRNTIEALALGADDLSPTAEELLPKWQNQEFDPQDLFVARVDGVIVGRAVVSYPIEDGSNVAFLQVEVLPEFRDRGIGRGLLEQAEGAAVSSGRSVLQGWAYHGVDGGTEPIVPPTGFGSVDRGLREVRFALAAGYQLAQVERLSVLELPVAPVLLEARTSAASKHATDYRILFWEGAVPDEWIDDFLRMRQRMSTDAPAGGLDFDEEIWTVERVRNLHETFEKAGSRVFTSAALHVPSGRLAGYSDLIVPSDPTRPATQEDTLVLREHRGHRLGMLLKLENIRRVQEHSPQTPKITTFNAEENRPMLDVNEAVGFRPFCYEGAWKKVVG